jgi:hypothetical protein
MNPTPRCPLFALLAVAGLFTGAGAVLAASCCVLPLVLVLGGLGAGAGVFAFLELLADYRTALLAGSSVLVAIAWVVYFRRRGAAALVIATLSWGRRRPETIWKVPS